MRAAGRQAAYRENGELDCQDSRADHARVPRLAYLAERRPSRRRASGVRAQCAVCEVCALWWRRNITGASRSNRPAARRVVRSRRRCEISLLQCSDSARRLVTRACVWVSPGFVQLDASSQIVQFVSRPTVRSPVHSERPSGSRKLALRSNFISSSVKAPSQITPTCAPCSPFRAGRMPCASVPGRNRRSWRSRRASLRASRPAWRTSWAA